MIMDPEIQEQYEEQLRQSTELLSQYNSVMASTLANFAKTVQPLDHATRDATRATRDSARATQAAGQALRTHAEAEVESTKKTTAASEGLKNALHHSKMALGAFSTALFSGTEGFAKYGAGLNSLGDATAAVASQFGPLGKAAGLLAQGLTRVAELAFKQADSLLQASDSIAKLGAVNQFTGKQIAELGFAAKLSIGELDKFIKPMESMGSSFKALGNGSADATKAFFEMAQGADGLLEAEKMRDNWRQSGFTQEQARVNFAVKEAEAEKMRAQWRRLGFADDQSRAEAMAKAIETMVASGTSVQNLRKGMSSLAQITFDYQKNLTIISEITGLTAAQQQEQQKINAGNMQWQVYEAQMNKKMRETTDKAEQEKIGLELERATKARDTLASRFGEKGSAMAGQYFSGVPMTVGISERILTQTDDEVMALLRGSKEGTLSAKQLGDLNRSIAIEQQNFAAGPLGYAMSVDASGELATAAGMTPTQMAATNIAASRDSGAAAQKAETGTTGVESGMGPGALDPLQKNRDLLIETEKELRTGMSKLLLEVNPLASGFNATTIAATALFGAATLAAVALTAMAGKAALATGLDALGGGGRGRGRLAAGGAGKLLGSGAGKLLAGSAVVGAGLDVYGRAQEKQSATQIAAGVGGGLAGAALGAKGGAMAGGAIGSLFGGVGAVPGAAIGGLLGGAGGYFLGGKAGDSLFGALKGIAKPESETATPGTPAISPETQAILNESAKSSKALEQLIKTSDSTTASTDSRDYIRSGGRISEENIGAARAGGPEIETATSSVPAISPEIKAMLNEGTKSSKELERLIKTTSASTTASTDSTTEMSESVKKFKDELLSTGNMLNRFKQALDALSQLMFNMSGNTGNTSYTGSSNTPAAGPSRVPSNLGSYMAATAMIESGGRADARATTSSAGGMFQFLDSTWKQLTKEMGKDYSLQDKFDPKKAAEVMAYFTEKQRKQLEKGTGRRASNTDLYMAHFLGAGGATQFLNAMAQDPNAIAADLDPRAARANRNIYYDGNRARTLGEVYALMDKKMSTATAQVQKGATPEFVQQLARAGGPQLAGGPPADATLISSKPDNVKLGDRADLSGMNSTLLSRFFTAAKEFGRSITVNSAYRSDQHQAELWVRGNILGEPGIHTAARPKSDTTITYGGKQYKVEGSGVGSKHGRGEALDISTARRDFDPYLHKYGLHRPFQNDPPHVELKAEKGGVFTGPSSGYPATLHGTELIAPLVNDSALMMLAKSPAATLDSLNDMKDDKAFGSLSSASFTQKTMTATINKIVSDMNSEKTATVENTIKNDTFARNVNLDNTRLNVAVMELLNAKLDSMVDAIRTTNDISEKILRAARN